MFCFDYLADVHIIIIFNVFNISVIVIISFIVITVINITNSTITTAMHARDEVSVFGWLHFVTADNRQAGLMQLAGHVEPKPGRKVQPTPAAVRKEKLWRDRGLAVGVRACGGMGGSG